MKLALPIHPEHLIECAPYRGRFSARACAAHHLRARGEAASLSTSSGAVAAARHVHCVDCPDGAARAEALRVTVAPPKPRSRAPRLTKGTSLAEYVPRNR